MSKRTRENKSRVKKANGTYKEKTWKNELPYYWVLQKRASKCGNVYTELVPYDHTVKYSTYFHEDMAAYFNKFFKGLFL